MKNHYIKILPIIILAVILLASCGGGNRQQSSNSSGFNPPVSNPPDVTGTPTGSDLSTEVQNGVPAANGTTTPNTNASNSNTTGAVSATESLSNPQVAGEVLVNDRCTVCHSTTRITTARKSPDEWRATVEKMISNGAVLDDQEKEAVIAYLSATYPK
jgi:hypothetical protein